MTTKRCFPPVVDPHTRVLVLGSLPGEVSLAQSQYYAHKQNRFWHLMGDVLGVDLVSLDYDSRLATLRRHRVGLWDVVAEARREGSLDSSIRDHQGNDLIGLIATLPKLRAIAFNGGTAAKIGEKALAGHGDPHAIVKLPSSSPAYTLAYAQKLIAWQALREWLA
ncbi:G:T/U mismatch-specific uracil/thymine DNA-glycosylase [Cupriavidus sp. U2]|uniref:DNA-deoxyinosine glycosylase n=1 Tax=Cupriavidus sp. U2 TaxID=2920269 RepID=UPI00129E047F|nr:DNA-deoxyinosine glycosylase [Cupriavidus sp. U2]KAI3589941.1 G:T/U mismatch-specific uracil/thymine DNA-glycosylase [Cupriavidus sp. U2]